MEIDVSYLVAGFRAVLVPSRLVRTCAEMRLRFTPEADSVSRSARASA